MTDNIHREIFQIAVEATGNEAIDTMLSNVNALEASFASLPANISSGLAGYEARLNSTNQSVVLLTQNIRALNADFASNYNPLELPKFTKTIDELKSLSSVTMLAIDSIRNEYRALLDDLDSDIDVVESKISGISSQATMMGQALQEPLSVIRTNVGALNGQLENTVSVLTSIYGSGDQTTLTFNSMAFSVTNLVFQYRMLVSTMKEFQMPEMANTLDIPAHFDPHRLSKIAGTSAGGMFDIEKGRNPEIIMGRMGLDDESAGGYLPWRKGSIPQLSTAPQNRENSDLKQNYWDSAVFHERAGHGSVFRGGIPQGYMDALSQIMTGTVISPGASEEMFADLRGRHLALGTTGFGKKVDDLISQSYDFTDEQMEHYSTVEQYLHPLYNGSAKSAELKRSWPQIYNQEPSLTYDEVTKFRKNYEFGYDRSMYTGLPLQDLGRTPEGWRIPSSLSDSFGSMQDTQIFGAGQQPAGYLPQWTGVPKRDYMSNHYMGTPGLDTNFADAYERASHLPYFDPNIPVDIYVGSREKDTLGYFNRKSGRIGLQHQSELVVPEGYIGNQNPPKTISDQYYQTLAHEFAHPPIEAMSDPQRGYLNLLVDIACRSMGMKPEDGLFGMYPYEMREEIGADFVSQYAMNGRTGLGGVADKEAARLMGFLNNDPESWKAINSYSRGYPWNKDKDALVDSLLRQTASGFRPEQGAQFNPLIPWIGKNAPPPLEGDTINPGESGYWKSEWGNPFERGNPSAGPGFAGPRVSKNGDAINPGEPGYWDPNWGNPNGANQYRAAYNNYSAYNNYWNNGAGAYSGFNPQGPWSPVGGGPVGTNTPPGGIPPFNPAGPWSPIGGGPGSPIFPPGGVGATGFGMGRNPGAGAGNTNPAQSFRQTYEEGRGLMMMIMGLNMVMQEFAAITGDKASPALQALMDGMRAAGSFGFGGAMIGDALKGVLGIANAGQIGLGLGVSVGALVAIVAQLNGMPDPFLNLNKSLDSIAKKDDTVKTLADLYGWTEKDASIAMLAAKSNSDLADALVRQSKARELLQMGSSSDWWQRSQAFFQTGEQYLGADVQNIFQNGRELSVDEWVKKQQQQSAFDTGQIQTYFQNYELMKPYAALNKSVTADANQSKEAEAMSKLLNVSDLRAKSVLENATNDSKFAQQLDAVLPKIEAYTLSIEKMKAAGLDTSAAQAILDSMVKQVGADSEEAAKRIALSNLGMSLPASGPAVDKMSPQQFDKTVALAKQLGDKYLADVRAAGLPTDNIEKNWSGTSKVMTIGAGDTRILTGEAAAMFPNAEQELKKFVPTLKENKNLGPANAAQFQRWLSQSETSLAKLGIPQDNKQLFDIVGQGGHTYQVYTTIDALNLTLKHLDETVSQNTNALRGSYNIPTAFGYRPPTPAEYYSKSGDTAMGPVNYPWLVGDGVGGNLGKENSKYPYSRSGLSSKSHSAVGIPDGSLTVLSSESGGMTSLADKYSQMYGMNDLNVLRAIIQSESNWNPNAVGDNGNSIGLLQNNMKGGRGSGYTKDQLLNPDFNLKLGMPEISKWYQSGVSQGLSGADLAAYVEKNAQRPAAGGEMNTYRAYKQLSSLPTKSGDPSSSTGTYYSGVMGTILSATTPNMMIGEQMHNLGSNFGGQSSQLNGIQGNTARMASALPQSIGQMTSSVLNSNVLLSNILSQLVRIASNTAQKPVIQVAGGAQASGFTAMQQAVQSGQGFGGASMNRTAFG